MQFPAVTTYLNLDALITEKAANQNTSTKARGSADEQLRIVQRAETTESTRKDWTLLYIYKRYIQCIPVFVVLLFTRNNVL